MLTQEHVHHLARRNDTLSQKIEKLKGRAASVTKHGVHLLEVTAGAALGGVVQGMSKDPNGAHILKVPADLGIGIALNVAGLLDLAGEEYSPHLANVGTGFLAAYFSDLGFAIGKRKKDTGSFFPKHLGAGAGAPSLAAVHGEVSPHQMAEALLQQMQARQAG
jgi:hypothetical protein